MALLTKCFLGFQLWFELRFADLLLCFGLEYGDNAPHGFTLASIRAGWGRWKSPRTLEISFQDVASPLALEKVNWD